MRNNTVKYLENVVMQKARLNISLTGDAYCSRAPDHTSLLVSIYVYLN